MELEPRKRSPRAPSTPLQEAIERTLKIYDKERRHPTPINVIAQDMGYKNANNGAALSTIASLRQYGLLDRHQEGVLAVVKELEDYKFTPDNNLQHELIIKWLRTPSLFAELLDKYEGGLPSDGNIKFDLIQKGFNPTTADACGLVFRQSVEYARYYEKTSAVPGSDSDFSGQPQKMIAKPLTEPQLENIEQASENKEAMQPAADYDRIPVRLSNSRRAWLEIPSPFYAADKIRLKAQIDLILTDDEGTNPNSH